MPVVQGSDDIGADLSCEHDVHRIGQPGGTVLQDGVSGEQERADRRYLPAACRYPAGDVPDDVSRGVRSFARSYEMAEFQ